MKKSVRDVDLKNKAVLMRVDYSLPFDINGEIADDRRVRESIPSIQYLLEQNCKIVLISHSGRPKGQYSKDLSLLPAANRLSELLNMEVSFADDCVGEVAKTVIEKAGQPSITVLENVRFHNEEMKNDLIYARQMAETADYSYYINESFATSHRSQSSNSGICEFLPGIMGLMLQREIEILDKVLENPEKPLVAILGGAKVADKIQITRNLIDKADCVLLGGGIANTFVKAMGCEIGQSLHDPDSLDFAKEMMDLAAKTNTKLLLPVDFVCADSPASPAESSLVGFDSVPENLGIFDIGPGSTELFQDEIKRAGSVIWNGAMGVFEQPLFAEGTKGIAQEMARSNAFTLVGGGDTAAAVTVFGCEDQISHISIGGGAFLEYLEGVSLPAISCLEDL